MQEEQKKKADLAALKKQMERELEEECAREVGAWQVKGQKRRERFDSNISSDQGRHQHLVAAKVEDNRIGSNNGKSNSESQSSGQDADDASSGGNQQQSQEAQKAGYSLAESISNIMSRFSLQPVGTAGSEPESRKEEESTADVTSPSSKNNDGKLESSSQSPEAGSPSSPSKELQAPTLGRKLSYAAKKRAKKAAKNAKLEQQVNQEDSSRQSADDSESKPLAEQAGGPSEKRDQAKKPQGRPHQYNLRSKMKQFQQQKQQEQNTMRKPRVGVVYDEEMLLHRHHQEDHPERPERVMAIYLNLIKKDIWKDLVRVDAQPAEDDVLALAHSQGHIQKVKDTIYSDKTVKGKQVELKKSENTSRFTKDTYENKYTAQAAYLAAGGTVEAIRAVCQKQDDSCMVMGGKGGPGSYGNLDSVFAIVRPPGHHAHCSAVGGFCFFNNVAVAAKVAQKEFGKRKVCIFDWDVHVGDGTSNVFYNDDSVLYISIHRFDLGTFFPGPKGKLEMIGEGAGKGYNLQFPFNLPKKKAGGTTDQEDEAQTVGDSDYIFACETFFFPIIREFAPDMIIISAGFDSAKGDPLGGIAVSPVGYAWMTQGLRKIQSCLAVVLEGGYSLEALEVSSEAVVRVLQTNPNDTGAFQQVLEDFGAPEEKNTYDKLAQDSLLYPRYSFRVTISNLSKLIKKQWGKIVEPLIFEKPRRKSSVAKSEKSSNSMVSDGKHQGAGASLRGRVNSMDDIIGTPVVLHVSESKTADAQPSSGDSLKRSPSNADDNPFEKSNSQETEASKGGHLGISEPIQVSQSKKLRKISSIIQVDDPIDEKEEIDREERKKKMSKSFSQHMSRIKT